MNKRETEVIDHEKDLGVMFSSDLKVSAQCKEAYSKANRIFGLIIRTIKYKKFKNPLTCINLYKSMVSPHLEYSIWFSCM